MSEHLTIESFNKLINDIKRGQEVMCCCQKPITEYYLGEVYLEEGNAKRNKSSQVCRRPSEER